VATTALNPLLSKTSPFTLPSGEIGSPITKTISFFGVLQKTITTQREFWKDNCFDYYTVIMTPTLTQNDSLYKGQSITGSGVKNGFLIQSSNNPFNSFYTMQYIFSHEMLHDWIGGKIPMRNEELNYWFSEGFTDYYAYKNRLRSGELSFEEWRSDFNTDVLAAHWKNPDRNKPNYLIKDDFWKSRTIEKIPYRRGAIFALWLDNQILRKSNYTKSLDDLMRDILAACSQQQRKFTDELFLEIAQRYLDRDLNYFFQKHVINGVDFEFKDGDFIEGLGVVIDQGIPQLTANQFSINRFVLP
jgi:predicted metalloprotease with PDZ domain